MPASVGGEDELNFTPGDCIDLNSYSGIGQMYVNRLEKPVCVLEVGDQAPGDACYYLKAELGPSTLYLDES